MCRILINVFVHGIFGNSSKRVSYTPYLKLILFFLFFNIFNKIIHLMILKVFNNIFKFIFYNKHDYFINNLYFILNEKFININK